MGGETKQEYHVLTNRDSISAASTEECKAPTAEVDIYRDTPLR